MIQHDMTLFLQFHEDLKMKFRYNYLHLNIIKNKFVKY